MNYQVADYIIRIKNASLAKRRVIVSPFGKVSKAIGNVLVKEGFLKTVKEETKDGKRVLTSVIAYDKRVPVLTDIKIISKPSLRSYVAKASLPRSQRPGMGVAIISTSLGIMTAKEAVKKGVGGELLFRVW